MHALPSVCLFPVFLLITLMLILYVNIMYINDYANLSEYGIFIMYKITICAENAVKGLNLRRGPSWENMKNPTCLKPQGLEP